MTKEELVKEYRVRELLQAARRVIGRYGFVGSTIDRVAEEAKVAKGTVYLYFANKDELLHAAIMDGLRDMIGQLSHVGETCSSPLERLKAIVREQFRVLHSNQDFLRVLLLETGLITVKPGDTRVEEMRQVFASYLGFIASVLQRAIDAGEIRRIDPNFCAFMLDELVTGSLRRRILEFTTSPIGEDAEAVLELFLRGIQS